MLTRNDRFIEQDRLCRGFGIRESHGRLSYRASSSDENLAFALFEYSSDSSPHLLLSSCTHCLLSLLPLYWTLVSHIDLSFWQQESDRKS